MLQTLLENPVFHHLLVIGAYRDNEVGPDHPLIQTLSRIESAEALEEDLFAIVGYLNRGGG